MGNYRRHIAGMDPEKMSTNVLRFYNGVCGDTNGANLYEIASHLDVNMVTTGLNGRDPAYPLVDGSFWAPIVLGKNDDHSVAITMTGGGGWSEITLPAGYHFVRKLPFGFVYNSAWDGIPNFHLSHWPKPMIRLTDAQYAAPWRVQFAAQAADWTNCDLSGILPDAARLAHITAEARLVSPSVSPGSAYLRSHAGQAVGVLVGSVFPGSANPGPVQISIRVDSLRRLQFKTTGDCGLTICVLGYDMTEPS